MNRCLHCQKETKNAKCCSQSCWGKCLPHRAKKKPVSCITCGIQISEKYKRKKFCDKCRKQPMRDCGKLNDWSQITFNTLLSHNPSIFHVHNRIRQAARNKIFPKRKNASHVKVCEYCGYNRTVEVCHIKPIASFSRDEPISSINSLDNLICLCPNCHWEFDNGLLDINKFPYFG